MVLETDLGLSLVFFGTSFIVDLCFQLAFQQNKRKRRFFGRSFFSLTEIRIRDVFGFSLGFLNRIDNFNFILRWENL